METMEMPMTAGISQSVNSQDFSSEVTFETATTDMEQPLEATENSIAEGNTATPDVNSLLENAKKDGDGFEQILTKIADGEFDSEENEENSEPESEEIATVEDEVVPVEEEVSVEEEEEDKKADELMELTKDMSKNIEKLPQEMQMNIKDFLEMMYLMYQMMKKEKNKRKKASFFEFLLKLVGTFLESLADPETLDKKVQEKENVQDVDDSQEMPSFEEFLKSKGLDLAA